MNERYDVGMAGWQAQSAALDMVKIWQKMNAPRFDNIMLKTKTVSARALPEGISWAATADPTGQAGGYGGAAWGARS